MALSKGSINKVILVGRLGRDPEVRYTPNGDAVAETSLATTESVKNRDGKREDRTEWHNLVIWRNQAEFAKEWLKKGQLVYVEGRLQTRQWEDKEGQKHSKTDIQVDQITMLGSSGRGREKETGEPETPPEPSPDEEIPF
ncbi:MAG TPA: single-stranded DNA-binding protein [Candidatus Marinimicrobia bacterium]|nr:single-stranded DNA-binding protein [Candidatus Neomarinimicrobiota bacterium]HRS50803.1 single-stranded DNA-binding protein [Candidatus Neomarinimicrobiota bacterium]